MKRAQAMRPSVALEVQVIDVRYDKTWAVRIERKSRTSGRRNVNALDVLQGKSSRL
jgi:hypothetical protein